MRKPLFALLVMAVTATAANAQIVTARLSIVATGPQGFQQQHLKVTGVASKTNAVMSVEIGLDLGTIANGGFTPTTNYNHYGMKVTGLSFNNNNANYTYQFSPSVGPGIHSVRAQMFSFPNGMRTPYGNPDYDTITVF